MSIGDGVWCGTRQLAIFSDATKANAVLQSLNKVNMDRGILNYAVDFFWQKKQNDGVALGSIPTGQLAFNGEVLSPDNEAAQIRAFKGVVYACSDLRGIGVAGTPWRVYKTKTSKAKSNFKYTVTREVPCKRKDAIFTKATPGTQLSMAVDIEEVLNGPYVDLLRNVNDFTNSFDLKKLTSLYLDLTGDCYWALIRNKLGIPVNVWVLPSEYTKPIPDNDIWVKGYKYKRGTTEIIYPKEDVVHFRYATPLSPFIGMAPIAAVTDAWNLRQYMFNFEAAMFKTGGNPKLILMSKNNMSKADADKAKESYKRTEDGGISVMGGQDFEFFQPETINARDMGYREGLALTRDEIAAAYHVPKSMLTADDVNRATAIAQEHHLAKYATWPQVTQIDQKMNEQLSPQFSEDTFVLFDDPVPENREEMRLERKANLELGLTTRAEERSLMGLDLVEGTDELLVPSNLVSLETALAGQGSEETDDAIVARLQRVMGRYREQRGA